MALRHGTYSTHTYPLDSQTENGLENGMENGGNLESNIIINWHEARCTGIFIQY